MRISLDSGSEALLHSDGSGNADLPALHAYVNGVVVEPLTGSFFATAASCAAFAECGVTGFWLDLDAAEAANPGLFIGQPLIIDLWGGDLNADGGGSYLVSMTVRMEKK